MCCLVVGVLYSGSYLYLAVAAAKNVKRITKKTPGRIYTRPHFFRPKTLVLSRKPKYERKAVVKENKMDIYAVIKRPVVTEAAMKKIEVIVCLCVLGAVGQYPYLLSGRSCQQETDS